MLRLIFAACVAFLLVGCTFSCVRSVVGQRQQATAETVITHRRETLASEAARWRVDPESVADQAAAAEAQRTLGMLEQLYRQEERLWSYYDTLRSSASTRRQLVQEAEERERELAQHRARLDRLQSDLDRLRPPEADQRFSFSSN